MVEPTILLYNGIKKAIDWYNGKQIKDQKEREKFREALQKIEITLNEVDIKIGLTRIDGSLYDGGQLKGIIPKIAEDLNKIAKENFEILPKEVYDGLIELIKDFVKFRVFLNKMSGGKIGIESRMEYEPGVCLDSLISENDKILSLLKEVK